MATIYYPNNVTETLPTSGQRTYLPGIKEAKDAVTPQQIQSILEAMRKQGLTQDSQAVQQTPSGGQITMPSVIPQQQSAPAGSSIVSGFSANNPYNVPAPQRDPVGEALYNAQMASRPTNPIVGNQSLASGGSPLSGPSSFAPRVASVQTFAPSGGTMGGGAGGAGGIDMTSILAALTKGYEAPRAELAKFGRGAKRDIENEYVRDKGQQEQDAISRGLGNSTIRSSLVAGAGRRRTEAKLNLGDKLASARAGLLERQMPSTLQAAGLLGNATAGMGGTNVQSILRALGLA